MSFIEKHYLGSSPCSSDIIFHNQKPPRSQFNLNIKLKKLIKSKPNLTIY